MTTATECTCEFNIDIPAVTVVCAEHSTLIEWTARDGYHMPCLLLDQHLDGETCAMCLGLDQVLVGLQAGKWALENRAEVTRLKAMNRSDRRAEAKARLRRR